MKIAFKMWIISILLIVFATGCSYNSSSSFIQSLLFESEANDTEEIIYPDSIEMEIEHSFPFSILAKVEIPKKKEYKVVEVKKCQLDKDTVIRLMEYFAGSSNWKDATGKDFSYKDSTFEAFQEADGSKAVFRVTQDDIFEYIKNNQVVVMREEYLDGYPELAADFSIEPNIDYTQALEIANKTIEDLDYYIDKNIILCYGTKAIGYIGDDPITYGWEFVYTRNCNGLQVPYRSEYDLWTNSNPPVASAPWEKECLFIFINENGLYRIDARGLGRESENYDACINLLPFEELIPSIVSQIKLQHPGKDYIDNTDNWRIEIKSIKLCSTLLNNVSSSVGYMIPTWEVEYTLEYSIEGEQDVFTQYTYFNAINGTYVEPRMTVHDVRRAYGLDD